MTEDLDRLQRLFGALEALDHQALAAINEDGYAALVSTLTKSIFSACADLLPPYTLGRALIGTAGTGLAYDPESPLIGPPGLDVEVDSAAALFSYIHLSRQLTQLGRGGAITRRLLEPAKGRSRIFRVSLSDDHATQFSDFVATPPPELAEAFQVIHSLIRPRLVAGPKESVLNETEAIYKDLPNFVPSAAKSADLSWPLVRVWLEASGASSYWVCGNPFRTDSRPWGGLYFVGSKDPTETELLTTGFVTREIFLRAHLIEQTRNGARAEFFDRLKGASRVFAMYYGHLADMAEAAKEIVKHVDPLSEDVSDLSQARQLAERHIFGQAHKIASAMQDPDIGIKIRALLSALERHRDNRIVRKATDYMLACEQLRQDEAVLRVSKALYRGSLSVNSILQAPRIAMDRSLITHVVETNHDLRLTYAIDVILRRWPGRIEFAQSGELSTITVRLETPVGDWTRLTEEIIAWWEGRRTRSIGGDDSRDLAAIIRGFHGSENPARLVEFLKSVICTDEGISLPVNTRCED